MTVQESETMLTGDEIRRARQRAGWSQGALAQRLGVAQRTVGNWERGDTSPSQKETVVRSVLAGYMDGDVQESTSLRHSSDAELLAEIARRLEKAQKRSQHPRQDLWAGGVDVGWAAAESLRVETPATETVSDVPLDPSTLDLAARERGGDDPEDEQIQE